MNHSTCCKKCNSDYTGKNICMMPSCPCHSKAPTDEGWEKEFSQLWYRLGQDDHMRKMMANINVLAIESFIASLLQKQRREIFQRQEQIGDPTTAQRILEERFQAGKSEAFSLVRNMVHELKDLRDPKTQIYKIINAHDFLSRLSTLEGM